MKRWNSPKSEPVLSVYGVKSESLAKTGQSYLFVSVNTYSRRNEGDLGPWTQDLTLLPDDRSSSGSSTTSPPRSRSLLRCGEKTVKLQRERSKVPKGLTIFRKWQKVSRPFQRRRKRGTKTSPCPQTSTDETVKGLQWGEDSERIETPIVSTARAYTMGHSYPRKYYTICWIISNIPKYRGCTDHWFLTCILAGRAIVRVTVWTP